MDATPGQLPLGCVCTELWMHRGMPSDLPKVTQRAWLRCVSRAQCQGPQDAVFSPGVLCTQS